MAYCRFTKASLRFSEEVYLLVYFRRFLAFGSVSMQFSEAFLGFSESAIFYSEGFFCVGVVARGGGGRSQHLGFPVWWQVVVPRCIVASYRTNIFGKTPRSPRSSLGNSGLRLRGGGCRGPQTLARQVASVRSFARVPTSGCAPWTAFCANVQASV